MSNRSRADVTGPQSPVGPVASAAITPEHPEARMASWHVLSVPRFGAYFAGSVLSNLGTWLQTTAQILLAYQLTHSAFAVGAITAAQFSGFLVFGPWAGSLAGRVGQKKVLVGTQIVSAAVAGALAITQLNGHLTESELFFGALGTGVAFTFALPVQTAMVSALVPERDTKAAMAMNSVSYNAGRALSPVLYLVVLSSIGADWAFAINAASFLAFAVTIVVIYPSHAPAQARPAPDWSGVRMAIRQPRIMLLLAMVAAITVVDDPIQVLGPSLAHSVLRVSTMWPAYFLSALGLGAVLGALTPPELRARVLPRLAGSRRAAIPLAALAASVVVFAAGLNPLLSLTAAVTAGMAALWTGAAAQALLLTTAGPSNATQVMALWAVAWAGSKPIASLADGWLASSLGVRSTALILAAPAFLIAVLELCMGERRRDRIKQFMRRYNARKYDRAHASA
jgi:MFS family permease